MESSRPNLYFDMVIGKFFFKNNQITLFLCFTFILKTSVGPPTGVSFYSVNRKSIQYEPVYKHITIEP